MLFSWHGQPISIKSKTKTLGGCKAYSQVSKENKGLYACCEDLIPIGYIDSNFQSDLDFRKSTSGYVFTLGCGAISWRSIKQSCITDSTMEVEYAAASRNLFGSRNSLMILVL